MFSETRTLQSPTGAKLAWHYEPARGDARGIVLISHGMAEHSKRYQPFAEFLAARGFHVYAWDHRGHGETTAPDAILGQFASKNGDEKVITDVMAIHAKATADHPGLPIILFGHSMGAFISFNTAISHPDDFAGFTIWNNDFSSVKSLGGLKAVLALTAMFKGSDTPANLVTKLTFETWGKKISDHKTLFDWLSHDEKQVANYVADPLCGFTCTVSLWRDLAKLIERGATPANFAPIPKNKPFHLVAGGKDPASNYSKGVVWFTERLQKSGFNNITTKIYPDARHETLNDTVREQAIADFADWAETVVSATI